MNEDSNAGPAELGWCDYFEAAFARFREGGLAPARVTRQDRDLYLVRGAFGEIAASVRGRMRFEADSAADFPCVGDWAAVSVRPGESRGTIHAVLPRRTSFSRKTAGEVTEEQVLAANVDVAFIVAALDGGRNFSLRRIERFMTLANACGSAAVVVLNKADLCEDEDSMVAAAESSAAGSPVIAVSALEGRGMDRMAAFLAGGGTGVFLGPSGVGKSSIINALLGSDRQKTREVRSDDLRGRHATTARELFVLPAGGGVIDTPGIREIQLWSPAEALDAGFGDVEEIAAGCRFRDCRHEGEPGCAVLEALGSGELDRGRFESWLMQKKELRYLDDRRGYLSAKKERFKKISKWSKEIKRNRE